MSKQIDGGPAFPGPWHRTTDGYVRSGDPGMSLRDWFAGLAMQSLITTVALERHSTNPGLSIPDGIALDAYALADAMLKTREE